MKGGEAFLYAGDALLLVKGNTRREIEERAAERLTRLLAWGRMVKLGISKEKKVGMP